MALARRACRPHAYLHAPIPFACPSAHFRCACVSASLACTPLHAETQLAPVPAPKGEHGGSATDEMGRPFRQADRGRDHILCSRRDLAVPASPRDLLRLA
jgi:hypothetical protein